MPFRRAALWSDLAAAYLGEVAAAAVYAEALRHLSDPEAHAKLAAWLDAERGRAKGLRGQLAGVGPPLPAALVGLVRDLAHAAGAASALTGPEAAVGLAKRLDALAGRRLGPIAASFPPGSDVAVRLAAEAAAADAHAAWVAAWEQERAADGLVDAAEAVERATIVAAPLDRVLARIAALEAHAAAERRLAPGAETRWRLGPLAWTSRVAAWDPPGFKVERHDLPGFSRFEHHRRLTPLGPAETLVADRLLVTPKGLPAPPAALRPSPWKLGLELGLWAYHEALAEEPVGV